MRRRRLLANWRSTLAEAGVTVDVVDPNHVRLVSHADDGADVRVGSLLVQVKAFRYPITPSQVPPAPESGAGLLILPSATVALLRTATSRGWSVVTEDGTADVRIGDRHVQSARAQREGALFGGPARQSGRGPISWPRWTIARVLLAAGSLPLPQSAAAQLLGTSQATVSRAIATMEREGLVHTALSTDVRRISADWDGLLDWWLQHYPGPGGTDSYWYSLDDLRTQARKAVAELERTSPTAEPVLSGDLAADYVAPWRRPASVTLYVRNSTPLDHAGFVSVASPEGATLIVRAPKDPGVWMPAQWVLEEQTRLLLADPLQVLHDLMHAAGPDAAEAAAHMRSKLRTDLREMWAKSRLGHPTESPAGRDESGMGR